MSKVIHLSEKAHARAKMFCKEHSLRMSDWVASLINEIQVSGCHTADWVAVSAQPIDSELRPPATCGFLTM